MEQKHIRRNDGMKEVIHRLQEKLRTPIGGSHFTAGGETHDLTCSADCILGNAQRMERASREVLVELQTEDNYYAEQAAARLVSVLSNYTALNAGVAELHQSYNVSMPPLFDLVPGLAEMIKDGEHMWHTISTNQPQ